MIFSTTSEMERFASENLRPGTEIEFKRTKDGVVTEFTGTVAPKNEKQKKMDHFLLDMGDHLPVSERYRSFNLSQVTELRVLATA